MAVLVAVGGNGELSDGAEPWIYFIALDPAHLVPAAVATTEEVKRYKRSRGLPDRLAGFHLD